MPDTARARQVREAGLHLAELLRTRYRHRWQREELIQRHRGAGVHTMAVATVLAAHLHARPRERHPEDRDVAPTAIRSTVSRALRGEQLSAELLERFIDAFAMRADHAHQLRAMLAGTSDADVVVGQLPPPAGMPGYRDKQFDTLMLHEHHWLGAEGLPVEHRSQINIRSRVDGLASYQYRIDTPHAVVEADQGGEVGDLVPLGEGIWAVDLHFAPLAARDTHYIEFRTRLHYDVAPEPVMRRGTHELIENLDIRVQFHEARLPSVVRFSEWAHYLPPHDRVVWQEEFSLRDQPSVHRYVAVLERAVVGFAWDW